jgi:hypothetical protein
MKIGRKNNSEIKISGNENRRKKRKVKMIKKKIKIK